MKKNELSPTYIRSVGHGAQWPLQTCPTNNPTEKSESAEKNMDVWTGRPNMSGFKKLYKMCDRNFGEGML